MPKDEPQQATAEHFGSLRARVCVCATRACPRGLARQIFDLRSKVHACNVYGRMAKSVLPFLLMLHTHSRPVFLLVVREKGADRAANAATSETSEHNAAGLEPPVLPPGLLRWAQEYARADELQILTSTQPNALMHAEAIANAAKCTAPFERSQLNPMAAGERDPKDEDTTFKNTFGERVLDLVAKLEPIAFEIEGSTRPVLVVSHEATCRALRAYLLREVGKVDMKKRELVDTSVHLTAAQLLEFSPTDMGGFTEAVHELEPRI